MYVLRLAGKEKGERVENCSSSRPSQILRKEDYVGGNCIWVYRPHFWAVAQFLSYL